MSLINIEYGSVARSELLNKNFLYLDEKIADVNNSNATSISSILSNIATINSRLNDLAESVSDYVEEFNSALEEYKAKAKLLVNASAMVPDWTGLIAISNMADFKAPKNGYLLLTPKNNSTGNLIVNGKSVNLKSRSVADDNSAQTVAIPVKEEDEISSSVVFLYAFFLPVSDVVVEGF